MELNSRIATQPHQFVGCWGYAEPSHLSAMLGSLLDRQTQSPWQVQTQPNSQGILAQLDAAGLPEAGEDHLLAAAAQVKLSPTRLTLKRDAFGRVPLYWVQLEQVIWFASRVQLLLPLLNTPSISLPALYGYSCFSYVPTPLTPIEGIAAVPAGSEQSWQANPETQQISSVTTRSWMEWQQQPDPIDRESIAIEQLQVLLKAAVDRQIGDLSDQPVGVFLSGGLDSSIVAALLVQAGVKVIAYTLDFGSSGISEYPYAEQVAHWLQIPLVKVDASPRRIRSALRATVQALDIPFGDGVTVPLFLLNQAARQDTQIVFNGEGGDQLFAGWTNKPLIAASLYQSIHSDSKNSFTEQYLQTFHRLWGYESQAFPPDIYEQIQSISAQDWLQSALDPGFSQTLLHRLRRAGLMLKGAQNIQPRATHLAFALGLQVRSPFCDLPLAQWTFRLTGDLCLQGACEKYILKRAAENWLPPEIVWRTKRGMGVPLTSWCLNEWWRSIGIWLNPARLSAQGSWQPDIAAQIVAGNLGGTLRQRRIGELLWLVLIWQFWQTQTLGSNFQPSLLNLSWNHPFWLPYPLWRYFRA